MKREREIRGNHFSSGSRLDTFFTYIWILSLWASYLSNIGLQLYIFHKYLIRTFCTTCTSIYMIKKKVSNVCTILYDLKYIVKASLHGGSHLVLVWNCVFYHVSSTFLTTFSFCDTFLGHIPPIWYFFGTKKSLFFR